VKLSKAISSAFSQCKFLRKSTYSAKNNLILFDLLSFVIAEIINGVHFLYILDNVFLDLSFLNSHSLFVISSIRSVGIVRFLDRLSAHLNVTFLNQSLAISHRASIATGIFNDIILQIY